MTAVLREPVSLHIAIEEMVDYFSANTWFINEYWPANEPRVKALPPNLQQLMPAPATIFEPGCGIGYISFLASRLGYQVTATDNWHPPDRDAQFCRAKVHFFSDRTSMISALGQISAKVHSMPFYLVRS
jgi:SAM-dependent methyltransferase